MKSFNKYSWVLPLLFVVTTSFAQSSEKGKIYFDKNWKETRIITKAKYYRKYKKLEEDKYLINDYYIDGTLQMKALSTNYKDPLELYGKTTYYYKNGKVEVEGYYDYGSKERTWIYYYETGERYKQGDYFDDEKNGVWKAWFADSTLKSSEKFVSGQKTGAATYYFSNGAVSMEGNFTKNRKVGEWKSFYDTGKISLIQNYDLKGLKHGKVEQYHTNGEILMVGNYANNKAHGNWMSFYENGKQNLVGDFVEGERVGIWKKYYDNGQAEFLFTYKEGIKTGLFEWYYPNGKTLLQEHFSKGKLKKSKAFNKEGKVVNIDKLNSSTGITEQMIAEELNHKLYDDMKRFKEDKFNIKVLINAEGKVEGVKVYPKLKSAILVNKIENSVKKMDWKPRIALGVERESVEQFYFKKNEKTGLLEAIDSKSSTEFTKYGAFPQFENQYSNEIYTIVESMPQYPGGDDAMYDYLKNNLQYPEMAKDAGIQGIVYVTFVVEESGEISNVRVLRGIGGGCDEAAVNLIKSMPYWEPGYQRGKAVRVQYNLPIRFVLSNAKSKKKKR